MGFGNADKTLTMKRRSQSSQGQAAETLSSAAAPKGPSRLHDLRYTKATPVEPKAAKALPRRRIIQAKLTKQISGLGMEDAAGLGSSKHPTECDDDDELSISDIFSVTSDPTRHAAEETNQDTQTKRFHCSMQDDLLMGKVMLLSRSPRKSKRKMPARKGSSTATLMTSLNTSGSSLDVEQIMNGLDGSRSLLDSRSSLGTPASRSRRNLQDSASSTDSNAIVLQAALAELQRGHDSKLAQEALESVGDLSNVVPEVALETPILSNSTHEARSMPSMDEVFQASKPKASVAPVEAVAVTTTDIEPKPTLIEPETAEESETVSTAPYLDICATPKTANKTRIMIRSRGLTNRLHASMDCIDFDGAAVADNDTEESAGVEASPHDDESAKEEVTARQSPLGALSRQFCCLEKQQRR